MTGPDPLDRILARKPPAFALIHRPQATGSAVLDVVIGEVSTPDTLAGIPLPAATGAGGPRHDVLVVMPYRQLAERGFHCVDDGSPLIALTVAEQATVPLSEVFDRVPDEPIDLSGEHFDVDDDSYAETVRRILRDEIGQGEGANFVVKRAFVADIGDYSPRRALSLFTRLLAKETGAYWTFIVHTGTRTFVGATPERHVSLCGGTAVMNPISGTYRYPATGPTLSGVMDFLTDPKEIDELYMVVDEELKMMARVCDTGGRIVGPQLREMTRLAHTEYFIEGRSTLDPREILRETMFAPTVTGSPLESACRVISRYEPDGRGYYAGAVALIGRDERGAHTLDSAILIRTADIDAGGRLRIGVGATLVRHSDPHGEVAETRAKAAGLISALRTPRTVAVRPRRAATAQARFGTHPLAVAALERRNTVIAGFWQVPQAARVQPESALAGSRVLVVDAEDTFTSMIDHQLRAMGLTVTVRRYDQRYSFDGYDLVVLGPGPGDPRDLRHPKIACLHAAARTLLARRQPFLAVCLSHQVLSLELGFDLVRREVPNQGLQREIDLFGTPERVAFYNTFAARSAADEVDCGEAGLVEVSRDPGTGEVHALRGKGFASMQFHAESVLTLDGPRIISGLLHAVMPSAATVQPG